MHSRQRASVLEHGSHRGTVAVYEGTNYITFVYCDPFYKLVFTAISFHDDVFSCIYHLGIVVHSGTIGTFTF